ncbi:MAG TPA: anthranilate synthase component I [Phycisphaerae bacterium]|nr:anthranilate synthase component I [Phycisphaerae bacterium]
MLDLWPDRPTFAALAARANTIPVYCQILSDQLTPVSAFGRLAGGAEHAFLLESVVGQEKVARYSFIGANPSAVFQASGRTVELTRDGTTISEQHEDPLRRLEELLVEHRAAHLPDLPRFVGGAVGYAGYDTIRYYEHLPNAPRDDRGLPDLLFGLYDLMIVFDHVQKLIKVVAHAHVERDGVERGYEAARARIEQTVALLEKGPWSGVASLRPRGPAPPPYTSNIARADFERHVDRCREYIRAGDVFQVVLSQRLCVQTRTDPLDIYRALRVVNPSPFMFLLKSPTVILVGSSPEILCRVENGVVTNRPLAGTRPRGRTEAEDRGLETELLADPKERAEHVMLVDLGRNDVGRVAEPGSIRLDEVMSVERYSHVMHICSNVSGRLAGGKTAFDALRAVLPVGTVSGAPKIRAMEIIDELEPNRRGPYAGAVGYFDFAGNMDTCIALRTLVITEGADRTRQVYAQVGAGIVADSDPSAEYQETLQKAQSMLRAIEVAESWTTP